jgi:hypothetical protein
MDSPSHSMADWKSYLVTGCFALPRAGTHHTKMIKMLTCSGYFCQLFLSHVSPCKLRAARKATPHDANLTKSSQLLSTWLLMGSFDVHSQGWNGLKLLLRLGSHPAVPLSNSVQWTASTAPEALSPQQQQTHGMSRSVMQTCILPTLSPVPTRTRLFSRFVLGVYCCHSMIVPA